MIGSTPYSQDVVGLRQAMDQLLEESFVAGPFRTLWARTANGAQTAPLPLDVYATPEEAVIVAAAPAMRPEDLEVTVHQSTVTLSGTVPNAADSEQGKSATWYLHELWHGPFRRSVTLPFEVDATKAEASFEHGIVRIALPKAEQAKPRTIPIKAAASGQAIGAGASR